MISLMTLGASQGSVLTLRASGPDADSAVEAIARLFESRFDEL
jgi:phosphotransferase system HPr (HPr) family protein